MTPKEYILDKFSDARLIEHYTGNDNEYLSFDVISQYSGPIVRHPILRGEADLYYDFTTESMQVFCILGSAGCNQGPNPRELAWELAQKNVKEYISDSVLEAFQA